MRLVDADALYETFERTPWFDNADRDIAEELLDDAPGWIKTADRLPGRPEYDWVLVAPLLIPEGYYGVPQVAELRNAVWYSSDIPIEEMCGVKVTHWMPLPKLPEVEG